MKINIQQIKELIEERFRGNKTWFSEAIGMDVSYVSRILNNPEKYNSDKFCNSLIRYCTLNNLDFKKYVFFD